MSAPRIAAGLLAVAVALGGCSGSGSASSPGSTDPGALPVTGSAGPAGSGSAGGTGGSPVAGSASEPGSTAGTVPGSGSAPASANPTPTPSPTVRLVPPAAPPIRSVPGYPYSTAPATVVRALAALTAGQPGVFSAPTARTVRRGSTTVGTVAVLALNRAYVGRPEVERKLVDGLVRGLTGTGYTVSDHALSGVRVVAAEAKGSTAAVWYRAGTVVLVVSTGKVTVPLGFAQAYLKQT